MKWEPRALSRRAFNQKLLGLLASTALIGAGFETRAFAGSVSPLMARWLEDLHQTCGDLKTHALTPILWQEKIEALFSSISLQDLLALMDFEKLMEGLVLPDRWGAFKTVQIPQIEGVPPLKGQKIFAYRKGRATAPHAHNNMVSVHIILKGTMHVRTYDRVRDEPGFLILKPSLDEISGPGSVVTMSDFQDNIHWFHGEEESVTFNIPVTHLFPNKHYTTPANPYGMIYVDPNGGITGDGLIRAPILDFKEAEALYSKA